MSTKMAHKGCPCWIPGCGVLIRCTGLCQNHYTEWKRVKALKPCACGCGELAVKKFVSGHNTRQLTSAEQSRRGLVGGASRARGYGSKGYVKFRSRHEHRIIAEIMLGRPLRRGEIVHHRDENKHNNHPDNLEVMTQAEHARHHFAEYRNQKALRA